MVCLSFLGSFGNDKLLLFKIFPSKATEMEVSQDTFFMIYTPLFTIS